MGCCSGAKKRPPKPRDDSQERAALLVPPARTEQEIAQDFHCEDCGLTLKNRGQNYHHLCRQAKPPIYQQERARLCGVCLMNEAGVCVEYKRQHPDRDCQVSVGIKIAYAACPIGQWGRRMIECPDCSRVLFEPDREPAACSYCGWPNKKRAATEATALPLAD